MKYLIFIFSMFFAVNVFAQTSTEKLDDLQHRYINKNLKLDDKTSKDFWPVYEEYKAKRREIAKSFRNDNKEELEAFEKLEREQKMLDLRKEYTTRFSKILNQQQLEDLNNSERNFKQILIRRSERKRELNSNENPRSPEINRYERRAPARTEPTRSAPARTEPARSTPSRSSSPTNSSPARR